MTLYSAVDLLVIWYWNMSYLPGASPFSLKTTGVPALPKTETGFEDGVNLVISCDALSLFLIRRLLLKSIKVQWNEM